MSRLVHGGIEELEIAAQQSVLFLVLGIAACQIGLNGGNPVSEPGNVLKPHQLHAGVVGRNLPCVIQLIIGAAVERVRTIHAGCTDIGGTGYWGPDPLP